MKVPHHYVVIFKNMVTLCLVGKSENTCMKVVVLSWEENIWNPNLTSYRQIESIKITWLNLQINTFATQIFHLYTWFYFDWLGLFRFCGVNYSCLEFMCILTMFSPEAPWSDSHCRSLGVRPLISMVLFHHQ